MQWNCESDNPTIHFILNFLFNFLCKSNEKLSLFPSLTPRIPKLTGHFQWKRREYCISKDYWELYSHSMNMWSLTLHIHLEQGGRHLNIPMLFLLLLYIPLPNIPIPDIPTRKLNYRTFLQYFCSVFLFLIFIQLFYITNIF